ncbi:hypothetical protein F5X98DRAFT_390347 [Xylaria grammica]|nr:hypothetical protein F5X98DRAFT_390347 [Xylaria grammica]
MSWAVDRETTREEDIAYSLFGIFDVNIPLLYGEGHRAFLRLQEEILRQSDDHTLFAWRATFHDSVQHPVRGLLASSPNEFRNFIGRPRQSILGDNEVGLGDNLIRVWNSKTPTNPITTDNKGIRVTNRRKDIQPYTGNRDFLILVLNCNFSGNPARTAGIYPRRQDDRYARIRPNEIADTQPDAWNIWTDTVSCLRTQADFHGHYFGEPWATIPKMLKDLDNNGVIDGGADSAAARYENAFYIRSDMFSEIFKFDAYSLLGMLIIDSSGAPRFYYEDLKQDLVLKAGKHSNAVLIVHCHQSDELILILLGVEDQLGTRKHWFNVSCVTLQELRQDPALMLETIRDMETATPNLRMSEALVYSSMFQIQISLQAFMVKACWYS